MKLVHISDLHLGKRLHQFSLLEDQKYILDEIVKIVEEEQAEGVLIAGDVYDKVYPSAEAVALFDSFLVKLADGKRKIFVISGNHDSPERIAFLGKLTQKAGVYLSPVYNGSISKVTVEDEYGELHIHLLPFIKPVHVRHFYPEEEIRDYTQAMQVVVNQMEIENSQRNVLVAHQFVIGAMKSDSEEVSVGGLDHIEAEVFADFDYVALGHIHKPQNMTRTTMRYCGTPLKYSFSECQDKKSVTIVEVKEKGNVEIKTSPLKPLRDMIKLRGEFAELINRDNDAEGEQDSYVHITLLDEQDIPNAFGRLSLVYPNLMQMEYDNTRTRQKRELTVRTETAGIRPQELFSQFYEEMNNQPLSEIQRQYIEEKIEKIWKGEAK